jgi:hypothetical protein
MDFFHSLAGCYKERYSWKFIAERAGHVESNVDLTFYAFFIV